MMLPTPTFSFTIPSIHDDTLLECRVYHPLRFTQGNGAGGRIWQGKGAIIAHPYAPLGGSYEDPVVQAAASQVLGKGFVVGLFNFRGAGSSKGRTSWNAKGELADYVSFAGFLIYYIQNLDPELLSSCYHGSGSSNSTPLSPIPSNTYSSPNPVNVETGMSLIFGGYSYGALITSSLPCTEAIVSHFNRPPKESAAAEIRLRARTLSSLWNQEAVLDCREKCSQHMEATATSPRPPRSPRHRTSMTYGGETGELGSKRTSRESRRSIDVVRRSLDRSTRKLRLQKSHDELPSSLPPQNSSEQEVHEAQEKSQENLAPLPLPLRVRKTQYLLISPLLPPASTLVTLFTKLAWSHHDSIDYQQPNVADERTDRLTRCSTLAIYGDKDIFTTRNKLRKWSDHLYNVEHSRFQSVEIAGADHFWHEDDSQSQMKRTIKDWIDEQSMERGLSNFDPLMSPQ